MRVLLLLLLSGAPPRLPQHHLPRFCRCSSASGSGSMFSADLSIASTLISRSDGIAWPTGSSLRPGSKARAIERRNLNLPFVGGFGRGSAAGTWLAEPFAIGTPETRCRDNPINGISMGSKLKFCSMRHSDRSFRHACLHFQSSLHCVVMPCHVMS